MTLPVGILWSVLSLSMYGGAVDLWNQTLIHLLVLLFGFYLIWHRPVLFPTVWLPVLLALSLSTQFSGAPARSQQELWNWLDYAILFTGALTLSGLEKRHLISGLFVSWVLLMVWGTWMHVIYQTPWAAGLLKTNLFASYLLIPIFLGLQRSCENSTARWMYRLFTALAVVLLMLTRSAGALIALGVGATYLCHQTLKASRTKTILVVGLITAILAVTVWKGMQERDVHRLLWWQSALHMAAARPFLGLGLGTFEMALPHHKGLDLYTLYAHNAYLQWLAEGGLLGLGSIFLLLFVCLRNQRNPYRLAASLSLLFHNVLDYSLLLPSHALLFWTLQSLGMDDKESPKRKGVGFVQKSHAIAISTILFALAGIGIRRFHANQEYARALYYFNKHDWTRSAESARQSLELDPLPPEPYALLGNLSLEEGFRTHSRGAFDQALVYTLTALQHQPIQPHYSAGALKLYKILGFNLESERLRHQWIETYPFFIHDKRFQTTL